MNQNRWLGAAAVCVLLGCGDTQTSGSKTSVDKKTDQPSGKKLPFQKDMKWIDAASNEMTKGDLKVRIDSVEVGHVMVRSITGEDKFKPTEETYLLVKILLTNVREKKLHYTGWGSFSAQLNGESMKAKLIDKRGNSYPIKIFDQNAVVEGQLSSASPYLVHDRPRRDLLMFETPPNDVKILGLELPGMNYGHKEPIRLRITLKP